MYLKKLMKNAALLLCSIAMISAGGEVHGMEIQAKKIPFGSIDGAYVGYSFVRLDGMGWSCFCSKPNSSLQIIDPLDS